MPVRAWRDDLRIVLGGIIPGEDLRLVRLGTAARCTGSWDDGRPYGPELGVSMTRIVAALREFASDLKILALYSVGRIVA